MLVLLHLFALLVLVILGFYVFVADPRSRANQTFAAFISFLALWTVKDLIFWNFETTDAAAPLWAAGNVALALLMLFSLIVFAWVFPENSRTPRRKAAALFSPATVLVPTAFFGLLWDRVGIEDGRVMIAPTPVTYALLVYIFGLYAYGSWLLLRKYAHYRHTQRGQQIAAILWATAVTAVFMTTANILMPSIGVNGLLPYASLFLLPGVVIYAYAISNFKLFSLQTALDQFRLFPITYKTAISIAAVAIVSFVAFQIPIVWWAFSDGMTPEAWRKYLVFSVISALVPNLLLLLLVVRSISRPLQRITLAAVQVTEGNYGTEVDLRRSNDEIGLLAASFNEMSRKMAEDIGKLRELNEQLARAEKLAAMGTLAAGVAHEVNNPLASISSLVQLLRSDTSHSNETLDKLALISAQITRITQVTRDLTDFARVRPATHAPIDINSVISASLRLAGFDAEFQKLDVKVDLNPDLPLISADAGQLQQVVLNLLLNARDAMPAGGSLFVTSFRRDRFVGISVADSGKGIDESLQQRLFDPFFTTKSAGKGTGLGLAVCYGIVTSHRGRIDVTSKPGEGTQFEVLIPFLDTQ